MSAVADTPMLHVRQRHIDDGGVQHHHLLRRTDDHQGQAQPAALRCPGKGADAIRGFVVRGSVIWCGNRRYLPASLHAGKTNSKILYELDNYPSAGPRAANEPPT